MSDQFETQDRRLDSLARICAIPQVTCVAVCCINERFYITANSLYTTNTNKQPGGAGRSKFEQLIKEIWQHLYISHQDSKSKHNAGMHNKIFSQICSHDRIKSEFGADGGKYTEDMYKQAIQWALTHQKKLPDLSEIITRHGHSSAAGLGYIKTLDLHRDFLKVEQVSDRELDKFTKKQIEAFALSAEILYKEDVSGIHAEVQLLAKIVDLIIAGKIVKGSNIYIGISRKCCLHCHCMLEAAKDILSESSYLVKIEFAGSHDLSFSKWLPPKLFAVGYNSKIKIKQKTNLAYNIGRLSRKKIKPLLPATGVSMEAEGSDSEPEATAQHKETDFAIYLDNLEQVITGLDDAIKISELKRLIALGKQLKPLKQFRALFEYSEKQKVDARQANIRFVSIFKEYQKEYAADELDGQLLFNFISNPYLAGKTIANYFSKFPVEDALKIKQKPQAVTQRKLLVPAITKANKTSKHAEEGAGAAGTATKPDVVIARDPKRRKIKL